MVKEEYARFFDGTFLYVDLFKDLPTYDIGIYDHLQTMIILRLNSAWESLVGMVKADFLMGPVYM